MMMCSLSDEAVQATNDDASACKLCAVRMGYWKDRYISHFIKCSERRAPEINRGYFARVRSVRLLLDKFLKLTEENGQVVNIGAGFDTLYWRLKEEGVPFGKFVEIDFSNVTSRKCHCIRKSPLLLQSLSEQDGEVSVSRSELHSSDYHLVSADLRNIKEVSSKLLDACQLSPAKPTIFIAECVLVYLDEGSSEALLKWASQAFETAAFFNYEQVNMEDRFGEVMLNNLESRGCSLAGVTTCSTLKRQTERFLTSGWKGSRGWLMSEVYKQLPPKEISDIEKLEFLDEKELLDQLFQHYAITFAWKDAKDMGFEDIGFT